MFDSDPTTFDEWMSKLQGRISGVMQFTIAALAGSDPANLDRCLEILGDVYKCCSKRNKAFTVHFQSGQCDALRNIEIYISNLQKALEDNPEFRRPELLVRSLTPRRRKRPKNVVQLKRPEPPKEPDPGSAA
jgi:hypothetical protein